MSDLFDFAVTTIFAREMMEASIIIGEYRTIIMKTEEWPAGVSEKRALRAVAISTIVASLLALLVVMAVAIPLGVLSRDFDDRTAKAIEGISKIVAAICILQLSLKLPQWLGVYCSKKSGDAPPSGKTLSLRSIRFNVAWNIWREVAECGVFLIPFFLTGEGVKAIPLSAVAGLAVGLSVGLGIYYANIRLTNKNWLAVFMSTLLLVMSTGLFTGGSHNLEVVFGETKQAWNLKQDFWSTDHLPMTVVKPFGYSSSRTVLQIVCFWCWLIFGVLLHYRKLRNTKRFRDENQLMRMESTESESFSNQDSHTLSTPPSDQIVQIQDIENISDQANISVKMDSPDAASLG